MTPDELFKERAAQEHLEQRRRDIDQEIARSEGFEKVGDIIAGVPGYQKHQKQVIPNVPMTGKSKPKEQPKSPEKEREISKTPGKAPAFQFYPADWRKDTQVQMSSFQTRGIWIEMLCCMWDSPERGKISGTKDELARMIGCEKLELENALKEIKRLKIGEVTLCHKKVTTECTNCDGGCDAIVTVTNRRMYKDEKFKQQHRLRQKRYRVKEGS